MNQADLDRLTGIFLDVFRRDLMSLPSVLDMTKWEEFPPEVLSKFVVISEDSLKFLVETLLREAVGIEHNLDSIREVVQLYGFNETPMSPETREFLERVRRGQEKLKQRGESPECL